MLVTVAGAVWVEPMGGNAETPCLFLSLSLSELINIPLFLALPICNLVYQTTETQRASVSAGCGVGGRVNKISS